MNILLYTNSIILQILIIKLIAEVLQKLFCCCCLYQYNKTLYSMFVIDVSTNIETILSKRSSSLQVCMKFKL